MAEAFPNPMGEISAALLSCRICEECFNSQGRTPRMLPCHHTFCSQCLEKLNKGGKLSCPMCRRDVEVSGPFPVDTTRAALLDIQEAVKTQQEAPCEGCDEGSRATSRCLDCAANICEGCCRDHKNKKLTRKHVMVSLSEAARSPSTLVQKAEMCQKHKDKKLEFYCKVCEAAVCSTCAITLHAHKNHEGHIVELHDVLEQTKQEVESLCRELDEIRESSFQLRAKLASSSVKEMDATFKKTARELQESFGRLVKAILERQDQAMEALKAQVKVDRLELEEQAAETESHESGAKTCTALGRTVASVGLPSHVLAQKQELERAVQEARAEVGKPLKASPRYKMAMDLSGLLKSLQQLGNVEVSLPPKTSTRTKSRETRGSSESVTSSSSGASATSSVPSAVSDVTIQTPLFQLERNRCGAGCTLEKDGRTLMNSNLGQSGGRGQSDPRPFAFPGTCGSVDLSQPTVHYWTVSVDCNAWGIFSIPLLEVGMASMQFLDNCDGGERISDHDGNAPTVVVVGGRDGCTLQGRCWTRDLDTPQPSVNRGAQYTCLEETDKRKLKMTLGFLYDNRQPQSPCLFLVETQSSRLLGVRRLPPSQPLLPVFRVWQEDGMRNFLLQLQTGPGILSDVTASLLQSLLGWRQSQNLFVTSSSSGASATSSVPSAVSDVTIQTPVFQLELGRCGAACTLDKVGRTLTNSTRGHSGGCGESGPRPFAFPGTCGSVDLSQPALHYWTVNIYCEALGIFSGPRLEVGMASMQTLDNCGEERISDHDGNAPTVVVVGDRDGCRLEGRFWTRDLDTPQPSVNRGAQYTCLEETRGRKLKMTLGFLYDNRQPQSPCLFFVETQSSRLLGVRRLPPSRPLLPVFRAWQGCNFHLGLQTGPAILSDVTASLLHSLLG